MATREQSLNQVNYQPSGKIGKMALVYVVLVCAVLLPLVVATYAIIIWYLPITFFNPILTVLFAIAIIIVHNLLVIEYGKYATFSLRIFQVTWPLRLPCMHIGLSGLH